MKRVVYILSFLMVLCFMSCEQEIDPGLAPNSKLCGQWTVKEYNLNMDEFLDPIGNPYAPYHLLTYNTANDADSIWVDNIYGSDVKMKAHVLTESSFERANGTDVNDALPPVWDVTSINISEALIVGDSIIFRVTMYDSGGNVFDDYYEAGHRTTGWEDDTHN
jgi:hypothetical protein